MSEADIKIDNYVTIHTSAEAAAKYKAWVAIHEYGPYVLRLVPTGLYTAIMIKHEKTGHELDITDYESV